MASGGRLTRRDPPGAGHDRARALLDVDLKASRHLLLARLDDALVFLIYMGHLTHEKTPIPRELP